LFCQLFEVEFWAVSKHLRIIEKAWNGLIVSQMLSVLFSYADLPNIATITGCI